MPFEPKIDRDTGETFYGFTHEEAVFITGLMSTGSEDAVVDNITIYIQMGHFFIPQYMIDEVLDGLSFIPDKQDNSSQAIYRYKIWHSDRTLYCMFNHKMYMKAYAETLKNELLAVYEDETLTDAEKEEQIAFLMANNTPSEVFEQRSVFFDNKKRMLYIDGKYYTTTYIKRRNEDE